jgi:hypothetical protein
LPELSGTIDESSSTDMIQRSWRQRQNVQLLTHAPARRVKCFRCSFLSICSTLPPQDHGILRRRAAREMVEDPMVRERRHGRRASIHHEARLDPRAVSPALLLGQKPRPKQSQCVPFTTRPTDHFFLTLAVPTRQRLRRRHERRPQLLRQRAGATANYVHHWSSSRADSFLVRFHLCADVLVGAGDGYLLGNRYAIAVSCAVVCGDGGV